MAGPSAVFTQMITAQHRFQGKTITDQVIEHNALWRLMKERGHIRREVDGGTEITYPIAYAHNQTIMNYTDFQRLNLSQNDFLSAVKYDWRQKAAYVVASGKELRINRGKGAMIKLVKAKKDNLVSGIANAMATEVYGDGSVDGSIGGLDALITESGEGTRGGIQGTASVNPWWRNKVQVEDNSGYWGTPDNVKRSLNKLHIKCTIGAEKPDLYTLTNDLYEVYQASLQAQQRFMSVKKAELGFETLAMTDGVPVIHDLNANGGFTGETGYATNSKYLYMIEHEDAHWGAENERVPVDQDGIAIPYFWMGQMVCTSLRHQGRFVAA